MTVAEEAVVQSNERGYVPRQESEASQMVVRNRLYPTLDLQALIQILKSF